MGAGKGYHIHSTSSKTETPTSLMSPMQDQRDEGNIIAYCCQPGPIHAVQQRDVGGVIVSSHPRISSETPTSKHDSGRLLPTNVHIT